jgi:LmbE family N-acetylglucosaminyl deacetylase
MRSVKTSPQRASAGRRTSSAQVGADTSFPFRVASEVSSSIADFDGTNSVYLSPHHDDVCFSLGGLVARRRGGWLINLFTRSGYSVVPSGRSRPDVETVTRIRTDEDNAFVQACGMTKLDLGLTDAALEVRDVFDLSTARLMGAAFKGPLLARIRAIASGISPNKRLTLFCPAGIGGHVNHVATMQVIVEALPTLQDRYRVLFYEDLHYASSAEKRQAGLLRLFAAMQGRRGGRISISFADASAEKLALVRLYRSQFADLPRSCAEYSPAVPDADLHEAVWDFGIGNGNAQSASRGLITLLGRPAS